MTFTPILIYARLLSPFRAALMFLSLGMMLHTPSVAAQETPEDESYPQANDQPAGESKSDGKKSTDEDDDNIIRRVRDTTDTVVKDFSSSERNKACQKFSGKLVSVSGDIWKIVACQRHQIHDPDQIFKLTKQGTPMVEADSRELAAIPVGKSWEALQHEKQRPCASFNGRYVTYSYTDIFFVDRCRKQLIPDYETLIQHRKEHRSAAQEIIALTDAEFYGMKQARDVTSIIDKEFAKLLDGSAGVDIIPIDEACKGVEGKTVSFYSRIYKIEKCRKREYDAENFTMRRKGHDLRLIELRAEQWLSMPDGKPMPN